jgi:hypothetical protein
MISHNGGKSWGNVVGTCWLAVVGNGHVPFFLVGAFFNSVQEIENGTFFVVQILLLCNILTVE